MQETSSPQVPRRELLQEQSHRRRNQEASCQEGLLDFSDCPCLGRCTGNDYHPGHDQGIPLGGELGVS